MWGGIIGLILQLIAGGVGGSVAGAALKQYDLGTIDNTIAGVVGGGGAQIIGVLVGGGAARAGAGGLDIGSIIGQIASGGVGGGILMVIIGSNKRWAVRRSDKALRTSFRDRNRCELSSLP